MPRATNVPAITMDTWRIDSSAARSTTQSGQSATIASTIGKARQANRGGMRRRPSPMTARARVASLSANDCHGSNGNGRTTGEYDHEQEEGEQFPHERKSRVYWVS